MTAIEFVERYRGRKAMWRPSYESKHIYGTIADVYDSSRIRFMPDTIEAPYPASWYFTPHIEEVTVPDDNIPLPLPG